MANRPEPYLCIAPACGSTCSGCNSAISPSDMRHFAVRYALLQRQDPRFGMPVEWLQAKTLDEAVDSELDKLAKAHPHCDPEEQAPATTPKQEAVTAAVVASPEQYEQMRLTLIGQVHELIDIAERQAWSKDADEKRRTEGAIAHARKVTAPYNYNGTIPRVADNLEDGGKAEAALRELVEARDALSKANAALNARFRTEQFVRVTMPSPEAERMDAAWSVARRIVVEADPQRTAIGMRREGE